MRAVDDYCFLLGKKGGKGALDRRKRTALTNEGELFSQLLLSGVEREIAHEYIVFLRHGYPRERPAKLTAELGVRS